MKPVVDRPTSGRALFYVTGTISRPNSRRFLIILYRATFGRRPLTAARTSSILASVLTQPTIILFRARLGTRMGPGPLLRARHSRSYSQCDDFTKNQRAIPSAAFLDSSSSAESASSSPTNTFATSTSTQSTRFW